MAVEGDWKNVHIKIVEARDVSDISEFLTNEFHFEEPIGKYLPQNMEYVKIVNFKIEEKLKTNKKLSLLARDKTSGNISAVQLVFRWTKDDADFERQTISSSSNSSQNPTFLQRQVLDAIYAPINDIRLDIFNSYGVSEVAWNFIASTGKAYRNQGLASELQKRMILQLKKKNFKIAFGLFSSPFSRKSAENAGFHELSRSYYNQTKGHDGQLMLPQANGPEDFVSLMLLQIEI